MSEKGKLIVISGPSGAGKSTVVFKAIEGRNDFCFSTSVTTRSPRPGEVDGREYFFIDRETYDRMVEQDELLEHAEYVTNGYGTPRAFVEQKLNEGLNVVLDIEIQGARQVRSKMPEATQKEPCNDTSRKHRMDRPAQLFKILRAEILGNDDGPAGGKAHEKADDRIYQ